MNCKRYIKICVFSLVFFSLVSSGCGNDEPEEELSSSGASESHHETNQAYSEKKAESKPIDDKEKVEKKPIFFHKAFNCRFEEKDKQGIICIASGLVCNACKIKDHKDFDKTDCRRKKPYRPDFKESEKVCRDQLTVACSGTNIYTGPSIYTSMGDLEFLMTPTDVVPFVMLQVSTKDKIPNSHAYVSSLRVAEQEIRGGCEVDIISSIGPKPTR